MATVGGISEPKGAANSAEVDELARFAVDDYNKKQNTLLEFSRVLEAKEQVVAGTMHYLTVDVKEGGKDKVYEAKIWVKPWMDFKEVLEFKPVD